MVYACERNESVWYGQKGVDGRSKYRAGMTRAEVRPDG